MDIPNAMDQQIKRKAKHWYQPHLHMPHNAHVMELGSQNQPMHLFHLQIRANSVNIFESFSPFSSDLSRIFPFRQPDWSLSKLSPPMLG